MKAGRLLQTTPQQLMANGDARRGPPNPAEANSSRRSGLLGYTPGDPVCARKILRGRPRAPRSEAQRRRLLAELSRLRVTQNDPKQSYSDRSDEHTAPPLLTEPRDQKEQDSVRQLGCYQRRATDPAIDEQHQGTRQDDVEEHAIEQDEC